MKRKIIIVTTVLVIVAAIVIIVGNRNQGVSNQEFERLVDLDGRAARNPEVIEMAPSRPIKDVWQDIHKMSHHVIVAEVKWGYKDLTEENINGLIIEILAADYPAAEKQPLQDILIRWKNGDFSQADRDHNFVWGRLNGNIGQATGVDWDGIPAWAREKQQEN